MQELNVFERERVLELTVNAMRESPMDSTNKHYIPSGRGVLDLPHFVAHRGNLICTVFVEYAGNATGHPARWLCHRPHQAS